MDGAQEMRPVGAEAPDWTLVAAVAKNGVIGDGMNLPWRLSSDLKRFKKTTMGQCLLMGRKTFESIGRPLPGRQTIVLSRSGISNIPDGVTVVDALEKVAAAVEPGRDVMVVGGAQIYALAEERCNTIWLTRVLAEISGDVFLPSIDWAKWKLESSEQVVAGITDEWATEVQLWKRIQSQ